jgi:DNA replication initiation complex subunit (GINS family)
MTEISYDSLRKIQLQERNFGALSALDEEFYERYNLWIAEQKRLLQKEFNIETLKAYENSKKIIEEISAKREQKIVLKVLKDMKGNSIDTTGLSKEEKSFYLKLLSSTKEFEDSVVQFSEKKQEYKRAEEKEIEKLQQRHMTIKMLVSIGKFVGPDGNTYGPFEPAQIINMEKEIAELLVKKGAAQRSGVPEVEANNTSTELPDTVVLN